jgi:hypothetical protein
MLQGSGYSATTSTVTVQADPPIALLLGRADTVRIDAEGVAWRSFHAASMDLTITNVDIIGRRADAIQGTITGAELQTTESPPPTADVTIDGSASQATATIEVSAAAVDRVVQSAFERQLGVAIGSTTLAAPNIIRLSTPAGTVDGQLAVDPTGALVLGSPIGSMTILSFDRSFPLRLSGVVGSPAGLRFTGRLDAEALLRG